MRDNLILRKSFWPGLIFLTVCLFWLKLMPGQAPMYAVGEPDAFGRMTWFNIWYWTDLGSYHRYSPTAYFPVALIDAHIIAPLYGIAFPSEEFRLAARFKPYYIFMIGLVSCLAYFLALRLSLDTLPALVTALYLGLHKGWYWGFGTMSVVAVMPLLLIYGMMTLFCWITYLRTRKKLCLAGFMISFLLLIGAWEQWINYLFFFVLFNVLVWFVPRARSALVDGSSRNEDVDKTGGRRRIFTYGVVFPVILFFSYMGFRFSTLGSQMLASTGEDAMVFSYPYSLGNSPGVWKLMLEDMFVNGTLHIASTIESLLFPWRMLSQAVINQYDIGVFNPAHATYSNAEHYLSLTDWYAGLLSGFFFCITIWLLWYLRTRRNGRDIFLCSAGLLLTYTGFLVHLPIVYRAYFAASGFAGLLDYKHMFSVLGFSLLVGWLWEKVMAKIAKAQDKFILTIIFVFWLIFTNFSKITKLA